jgi:hypothetical protein
MYQNDHINNSYLAQWEGSNARVTYSCTKDMWNSITITETSIYDEVNEDLRKLSNEYGNKKLEKIKSGL